MSYMTPPTITPAAKAISSCQASSSKRTLAMRAAGAAQHRASSSSPGRSFCRPMTSFNASQAPIGAAAEESRTPQSDLPFPNLEYSPRSQSNSHRSTNSYSAPYPPESSSNPTPKGHLADLLRSSLDNLTPSRSRAFKGVHSRSDRAKGTTPQEAKALNQVIAELYKDLEKFGSPLQSSSPITDPFGHNFANAAPRKAENLAQLRTLVRRREDGISEDEFAEVSAEVSELKEDMSSVVSESDLIQWSERRIFKPSDTSSDGPSYSRTYPYMLAHLMATTRDTFKNPSLALAFFQHAQTLSLESYISGCLTTAYNQLLKTRWRSFNDLEGVTQAVKEMETNGVAWDPTTQKLVEGICESLSATSIMGSGEGLWREFTMARWRYLEGKVQMGAAREEGWGRMAEAQRMARGFDKDTRDAQARFGTDAHNGMGHGRHRAPGRIHRAPRRHEDEDHRWSRGWDEEVEESQRAFA